MQDSVNGGGSLLPTGVPQNGVGSVLTRHVSMALRVESAIERCAGCTHIERSPYLLFGGTQYRGASHLLSMAEATLKNDATKAPFRVRGLCAAVYTPFTSDGRTVTLEYVPLHADELVRQGVTYAFVCGTTGEGAAMSVAERKAVLEAWITAARPRNIAVLVHVGAEAVPDALELASHAQAVGAAAIGIMPPVFFKPHSLDAIVSLLSDVSAAAPALPLYYYHFPDRTGVALNLVALLKRVDGEDAARVPTFRGAKFTDHDLGTFAAAVSFAGGKYDILSGRSWRHGCCWVDMELRGRGGQRHADGRSPR
jgi:hypothetical protein